MLQKLKNPQILIGVVPLVCMLLIQFGITINMEWVQDTLTIVCSILILLGILNNPDTDGFDLPFKKK